MKNLLAFFLLFATIKSIGQVDISNFFQKTSALLGTYVDEKGLIDYGAIKENEDELLELTGFLETIRFEEFDDETNKALLINTYNLLVIKQVITLMPLKSPLDDPKFFNGRKHMVAGKNLTLDDVEKGTLMKNFFDPRLHFVLVCAAKSCPPLANFAFTPENLEQQLEQRTRYVLNLDSFIQTDKKGKASLSQIFNWYKADFTNDGESLIDYVNKYRDVKFESSKTGFYEYDWSLNIQ